jgi:hypothetical protein
MAKLESQEKMSKVAGTIDIKYQCLLDVCGKRQKQEEMGQQRYKFDSEESVFFLVQVIKYQNAA